MKTFPHPEITKEKFIEQIKWHMEQDRLARGSYHRKDAPQFKGCAVGCTIHSIERLIGNRFQSYDEHYLYEKYLGIPEWLAYVEDRIFENLSEEEAKKWPLRFSQAIPKGNIDFDKVRRRFMLVVLNHALKFVDKEFKQQHDAIKEAVRMYEGRSTFSAGHAAAAAAAYTAAYTAAYAAAYTATDAAAETAVKKTFSFFADELVRALNDEGVKNEN